MDKNDFKNLWKGRRLRFGLLKEGQSWKEVKKIHMNMNDKKVSKFLGRYNIGELLEEYGELNLYKGYKDDAQNVTLAVALSGKKDFSIILSLQEELNKKGFNNFCSFDNNQPGWPLYTPHIICNAYTLEAKVGYYDQFTKPEDRGEIDITICREEELDKIVGVNRSLSQTISYSEAADNNYLKVADDFQEKAKIFLEKYQVMNFLREFGEPEVYGSYKLGLMNRPDMDTVLVVEKKDFSIAMELQKRLQEYGFTNFWVFDNSRGGSVDDPKHIIVDAYIDEWEMGITICSRNEAEEVLKMTKEIEEAIKNEPSIKEVILKLKHEVAQKYGVRYFPSTKIYNAVIEDQAKTVEDFEKYLAG